MGWRRPPGFERHRWDFATSLGETPHWGRWRDGMGMTPERIALFGRTVDLIGARLGAIRRGRSTASGWFIATCGSPISSSMAT